MDTSVDITSRVFSDARSLWFSVSRKYTGALPRCLLWNPSAVTSSELKELYDTDHYDYFISHAGHLDDPIGSTTILNYILTNRRKIIVRTTRNWAALSSASLAFSHPCYTINGTHFTQTCELAEDPNFTYPATAGYRAVWFYDRESPEEYPFSVIYSFNTFTVSGTTVTIAGGDYTSKYTHSSTGIFFHLTGGSNNTLHSTTRTITNPQYTDGNTTFTISSPLDDRTGGKCAMPTGDFFGVPILPETMWYWHTYEDYAWSLSASYGKAIVDRLAANGLVPDGIQSNWEDFVPEFDSNLRTYYLGDYRFDLESPDYGLCELAHKYGSDMLKTRIDVYEEKCSWANGLYSNLFDTWSGLTYFYDWSNPTMKAYNRKKSTLKLYSYWPNHLADTKDTWYSLGYHVANSQYQDIHLFNAWYAANCMQSAGNVYNPTGTNADTIGQTIALCKGAMALGSINIILYIDSTGLTHPHYSSLIAYNEMQQYSNFIINGLNYIPPFGVARSYKRPIVGDTLPHNRTCFYGYDYWGNTISDSYWISCRRLGDQYLYYGTTLNSYTATIPVRSPTNQIVYVTCHPLGKVTII